LNQKQSDGFINKTTNTVSVNTSQSFDLLAGQHILAGNVTVSNDGQNFHITFNTQDGWLINEVHVWIGEHLSALPKNKGGNPMIGQFPYKASNLNGVTTYSVEVPMSVLGSPTYLDGKTIYVATHAVVANST